MATSEIDVEISKTSPASNTEGKECPIGRYINEAEGKKIIDIAATWVGTPYSMVGANSEKLKVGDCSGTTNKIYKEAGFPYPYQTTAAFVQFANKTNIFREINPDKTPMQIGDVLLWPGHMAIYAPFPDGDPRRNTGVKKGGVEKNNNMYTAFNAKKGTPYGPFNIETFRPDAYRVFRYYLFSKDTVCK